MSLKFEPSSEPLHIPAKQLFRKQGAADIFGWGATLFLQDVDILTDLLTEPSSLKQCAADFLGWGASLVSHHVHLVLEPEARNPKKTKTENRKLKQGAADVLGRGPSLFLQDVHLIARRILETRITENRKPKTENRNRVPLTFSGRGPHSSYKTSISVYCIYVY